MHPQVILLLSLSSFVCFTFVCSDCVCVCGGEGGGISQNLKAQKVKN